MLASAAAAGPTAANRGDALIVAIRAGDVAIARDLLDHRVDPNQRLAFAATPLSWAVDSQNPAMVQLLLASGATPNTQDANGTTPLAIGCELGDPAIVAMLLAAGAHVRTASMDGVTPLAICAGHAPAEIVARMLAAGAEPDTVDSRGQTPLMWAAAAGRTDTVEVLLKAGANVNRASMAGFTPLLFAIKSGVVPATIAMLAAHARTDERGPEGTSALQLALYQKNYGAAALLVERGADLQERDRNGNQPLQAAAAGGDVALVRLLLAKGADPNALSGPSRVKYTTESNFGHPPPEIPPTPALLAAAANGQEDVMHVLLAAGADPAFRAKNGTGVLLAATESGNIAALALALDVAPDPNVANANGATPLHLLVSGKAAINLEPEMMKLLAAHHARTDIKNAKGETAADLVAKGSDELKTVYREIFPSISGKPPMQIAAANTESPTSAFRRIRAVGKARPGG